MVDKEILVVDAEIIEDIPQYDIAVPVVQAEDLPEGTVPAPDPKHLRQGYFAKGGRGGPGRKRIFQSAEEMESVCNEYFQSLLVAVHNSTTGQMDYKWKTPPTVPGLARALGMTSEALRQYGLRDEFGDVVEWAKDVIRENLETGVQQPGNQSGRIFCMKNLGYSDTKTYTFSPPSRLAAAQSPEEIAKLVDEDIV